MGNLTKKIASNFDDLIYSKPPEEIEEENTQIVKQPEKKVEKSLSTEIKPEEPETERIKEATPSKKVPKGKRIQVTTYFEKGNYDDFEDMRDELQKAVRRETGIKLKEATVVEFAVLLLKEDFEKNPKRIIERYSKLARKNR